MDGLQKREGEVICYNKVELQLNNWCSFHGRFLYIRKGTPRGKMIHSDCSTSYRALFVRIESWQKQSHCLFDYQSPKISHKFITIPIESTPLYLYLKYEPSLPRALLVEKQPLYESKEYQLFARIMGRDEGDQVRVDFIREGMREQGMVDVGVTNSHDEDSAYRVLNSWKRGEEVPIGQKLQVGQTIKLGRVRLFVRQIRIGQSFSFSQRDIIPFRQTLEYPHMIDEQENICRICLEKEKNPENFLISPCKCSGSVAWIHLHCFHQWTGLKMATTVRNETITLSWDGLFCEVCKEKLPIRIQKRNGTIVDCFTHYRPQGNYILLERMDANKSIIIVAAGAKRILFGRSSQDDVFLSDITVSRSHACLQLMGSDYYLFDQGSRFGTLLREQNLSILVEELGQSIQTGRTKLQFSLAASPEKGESLSAPIEILQ